MTNRYVDHLLVLPEDDANRQLVNGFQLSLRINPRCIQVLPSAGGWRNALAALENPGHIKGLQTYPKRHLLLMIDFDQKVAARMQQFSALRAGLMPSVQDRV